MSLTNTSIRKEIYGVHYVNRELDRRNVNIQVDRPMFQLQSNQKTP